MVINNSTTSPLSQLLNTQQATASHAPAPQAAKPEQGLQSSSVVTLSAQAQQMNNAEAQANSTTRAETRTNIDTERAETRPQEMKEPPGIQFMAGEEKNGRISTFA